MAESSSLIGRFMQEIFSNIGKQMVGLGLIVGFILAGLVVIILLAAFGSGKIRRFFNER
jgi:tetrahydromethanopterin S-methyltransferase subunit F